MINLTVSALVAAPVETVWRRYSEPSEIERWNAADPSWHCPKSENDLREGGRFASTMASRDGQFSFVLSGTYSKVIDLQRIEYLMDDGRKASVVFKKKGKKTEVVLVFEAETDNPHELQVGGWQAILNNFKRVAERSAGVIALRFDQKIDASAATVFEKLIGETTYPKWTAAFNPTSRFEGSWEKGAEIHFVGTSENGQIGGLASRINERVENRFIEIEHLGLIENGQPILKGPKVAPWKGSLESYSITDAAGGGVVISVAVDTIADFKSYFEQTFPQALLLLKMLCEG